MKTDMLKETVCYPIGAPLLNRSERAKELYEKLVMLFERTLKMIEEDAPDDFKIQVVNAICRIGELLLGFERG